MEEPTKTIRQTIISDLVLINAIQRMPKIMSEITARRKDYAELIMAKDLSDKIANNKELIDDIEGGIAQTVQHQLDDDGKLFFKNKESRTTEITLQLSVNDGWREAQEALTKLKNEQVVRDIKAKQLDADIKYLIMESDFLTNLFKLAAGLAGEESTRAEREIASIGSAIRTMVNNKV